VRVPTIEHAAAEGVEAPSLYSGGLLNRIGIAETSVEADWVLACEDVGTHFTMHVPLVGGYQVSHRGADIRSDRRGTALYQPGTGPLHARMAAGYRALCVTFEPATVYDGLGTMLGAASVGPVSFAPFLKLDSGQARSWAGLLLSLRRSMNDPLTLVTEPLVAGPLAEAVLNGFLLVTSHSHSVALHEPPPPGRPSAVRAAVDLMEADPGAPLTVSAMAQYAGVSVRTLQNAFRRHMGTTPLGYLRDVRLRRAHEDLREADPSGESVAGVARRWGFGHTGRFAAAHAAKYGETPLKTLHG
jgi:AraC-like DNA-binding protein